MQQSLDYSSFEKRYKNKEYIGSGGFGKVYKVFDYAINHYVALKVSDVRPEWSKFTLKNEVELVNRMDKHRNIARYDACYRYNTGITGEMDFAILKFYEDGNLEQFLKGHKIGLDDKKLIIQGVLEGIQFLHRNNVIHRDLKAQNILMSREDGVWCPKITDFGLSREVGKDDDVTNSAVGISYAYAAPEQILNQKIYKNVDVWAAGVMIYRIIEDELPFKGRGSGDDKSAQSQLELSNKIVNLDLPPNFDTMIEPYRTIVKRCLVKDPKERAQSCEELLDILHGKRSNGFDSPLEENLFEDGSPNADGKTELVINEPERLDTHYEPVESSPRQAEKPTPSQSHFPPPMENVYEAPDSNPTQIITPQTSYKPKEEEKQGFVPSTGTANKSFKLKYVLIIFGILAIAAATFFTVRSLMPGEPEVEEVVLAEEEINTMLEPKQLSRYTEYDLSLTESMDVDVLATKQRDLALFVNENPLEVVKNYRLKYLQAKLELYLENGNSRQIKINLEKAARVALANDQAQELLTDMENDGRNDLSEILEGSKRLMTDWTDIKELLQ